MAQAASDNGISVYQLSRDACPPLLGVETTDRDPAQPKKYAKFQRLAFDEIAKLRRERGLRTVILSGTWSLYAADQIAFALRTTLDRLGSLGLRVMIIGPTPTLRYRAPDCLLRHDEGFCGISRADFERQRERVMLVISEAASGRENVRILDPTPFFCDDNACPVVRDGMILYKDTGHVSATASRAFAEFGREDLRWLR